MISSMMKALLLACQANVVGLGKSFSAYFTCSLLFYFFHKLNHFVNELGRVEIYVLRSEFEYESQNDNNKPQL